MGVNLKNAFFWLTIVFISLAGICIIALVVKTFVPDSIFCKRLISKFQTNKSINKEKKNDDTNNNKQENVPERKILPQIKISTSDEKYPFLKTEDTTIESSSETQQTAPLVQRWKSSKKRNDE